MSIGTEFLSSVIKRVNYYKGLADKTFAQLEENDFHYQHNEESNSVAVIIQHMYGNMLSRWTNFLTEDGEKTWRQRDDEFEVHDYSKAKLLDLWEKGWDCYLRAMEELKEEDLLKTITIRAEKLTVIDAILRQLAHYPYHIGQILYVGKMIRNKDWVNLSMPRKKG